MREIISSMEKFVGISSLFQPPSTVQGAKILNKEAFRTIVNLPALRIEAKKCSVFLKNFSKFLLNQPRLRNIVSDANSKDKKILLLNPQKSLEDLNEKDREFVENQGAEKTTHDLVLGYEHWTTEQVLRAVLPPQINEIPSSFETIGHIAHVNLRDSQLDYKHLIGMFSGPCYSHNAIYWPLVCGEVSWVGRKDRSCGPCGSERPTVWVGKTDQFTKMQRLLQVCNLCRQNFLVARSLK